MKLEEWAAEGIHVISDRGLIAICPLPQNGGTFNCAENARLIALLPELLEVLDLAANALADLIDFKPAYTTWPKVRALLDRVDKEKE